MSPTRHLTSICIVPVTLKVISEKYLGDEAARLSFLAGSACRRERPPSKRRLRLPPWKAGARLLLRDGVCGGETLDNLIKRSGPLEVKFALLKELAAFNTGLCVTTTRLPIGDIAGPELSFLRILGRAHCQRRESAIAETQMEQFSDILRARYGLHRNGDLMLLVRPASGATGHGIRGSRSFGSQKRL